MSEADLERRIARAVDEINEKRERAAEAEGQDTVHSLEFNVDHSRLALVISGHGIYESGAVFSAKTVKGHTNYVIMLRATDEWVYWVHGDRAKKTQRRQFIDLIMGGDLQFVPKDKVDPERIALSVLGLNAMVAGMTFNDYINQQYGVGEGSDGSRYQEA